MSVEAEQLNIFYIDTTRVRLCVLDSYRALTFVALCSYVAFECNIQINQIACKLEHRTSMLDYA